VAFDPNIDYFDQVELAIRYAPGPGDPPIEVWVYHFSPPPDERADWPTADLRHLLLEKQITHLFDDRRRYTSWGASGAVHLVTITAQWAVSGVVGTAASKTLAAGVRVILERLASSNSTSHNVPLERDHAITRAQWQLAAQFDIPNPEQTLSPVSEEYSPESDTWTFVFAGGGSDYHADVHQDHGLMLVLRLRRQSAA
jgi:hypothetical protein